MEQYWVDFANQFLGGGAFGYGSVQEEIMVQEFPEFAELVTNCLKQRNQWFGHQRVLKTRYGSTKNGEQVQKGSPSPILMENLHRVQTINPDKIYGNKLWDINTRKTVKSSITTLGTAQIANILAIAF